MKISVYIKPKYIVVSTVVVSKKNASEWVGMRRNGSEWIWNASEWVGMGQNASEWTWNDSEWVAPHRNIPECIPNELEWFRSSKFIPNHSFTQFQKKGWIHIFNCFGFKNENIAIILLEQKCNQFHTIISYATILETTIKKNSYQLW